MHIYTYNYRDIYRSIIWALTRSTPAVSSSPTAPSAVGLPYICTYKRKTIETYIDLYYGPLPAAPQRYLPLHSLSPPRPIYIYTYTYACIQIVIYMSSIQIYNMGSYPQHPSGIFHFLHPFCRNFPIHVHMYIYTYNYRDIYRSIIWPLPAALQRYLLVQPLPPHLL